jgi:hypothetical protein
MCGTSDRSDDEARLSTAIKDTMRLQSVHMLVDAWYTILTQYQGISSDIVNSCLNVIGLYVSWIDVTLVVNDRFIPLLFQYLELPDVRCVGCVLHATLRLQVSCSRLLDMHERYPSLAVGSRPARCRLW